MSMPSCEGRPGLVVWAERSLPGPGNKPSNCPLTRRLGQAGAGQPRRLGAEDNNVRMDSQEPDLLVVGERVALGPLRGDLAGAYARWMNQLEVRRGLVHRGIATAQSQQKWVEENLEKGAKSEPEGVEFTVYDRSDSTPVGTAGLF